jgi:hypothetical protein
MKPLQIYENERFIASFTTTLAVVVWPATLRAASYPPRCHDQSAIPLLPVESEFLLRSLQLYRAAFHHWRRLKPPSHSYTSQGCPSPIFGTLKASLTKQLREPIDAADIKCLAGRERGGNGTQQVFTLAHRT